MRLPILVMLAGLARAGLVQEADSLDKLPVLSLADIVLEQYVVQFVDPEELLDNATELVGRSYYVAERGGTKGDMVENLRQLGRNLIVYDTPDQVGRVLALFRTLDVRPPETGQTKTFEYAPRFVSLKTVLDALKPLNHPGFSMSDVDERGLIVVRARSERIQEIQELLARVDVPERQVLVTCYLVGSVEAVEGPPLPAELVGNLSKILPEHRFARLGMALLQTGVGSERPFSLEIQTDEGTYQLTFKPVAFDPKTGSLTVERCQLREAIGESHAAGEAPVLVYREIFLTNTTFRGGEYTVLAATGVDPFLLLAVRVTPTSAG
jgi:hypothetical protein